MLKPLCFLFCMLFLLMFQQGLRAQAKSEKSDLLEKLRPFLEMRRYHEQAGEYEDLARLYIRMGEIIWETGSRDNGLRYLERAAKAYEDAHRADTLPLLYKLLAERYYSLEDRDAVKKNCRKGLEELNNLRNLPAGNSFSNPVQEKELRMRFLKMLNNIYDENDESGTALSYGKELLALINPATEPELSAQVCNNIGFIYLEKKDGAEAEAYFRKAVDAEEGRKDRKSASQLVNYKIQLAQALFYQNKITEAESELKTAKGLCLDYRLRVQQARIESFSARIQLKKNDLMMASKSSQMGVELMNKESGASRDDQEEVLECHADVMRRIGNYSEAFRTLEKLKILKNEDVRSQKKRLQQEQKRRLEEKEFDKQLDRMDDILKNFEQDQQRQEKARMAEMEKLERSNYQRIQDSLSNAIRKEKDEAKRADLENQLKLQILHQQQSEFLIKQDVRDREKKNQQRLDSLALESRISSEKQKQAEIHRSQSLKDKDNATRLAFMAAISFIVAFFAFIYSRGRNKRLKETQLQIEAANMALGSLNRELNGKNKSITDSIQYAQGIQSAILPEESRWKQVFPDSFTIYLPKDIVSGDFYFLTSLEDKHFLAFVDCTGHGVPGALMSIIGHNMLVSAIDLQGLTNPAEILKFMDQGLRRSLQREGRENQDGMEIGICCFDMVEKTLQFAGSRRPLYGIRNGEFFEWKGDRTHLGTLRNKNADYQNYECPLGEISEIWLTTDGYPDQLGGPEIRRFHSSRMREIMVSLAGKDAETQRDELIRAFQEWRGSTVQIDDVMLIGIRPNSISG